MERRLIRFPFRAMAIAGAVLALLPGLAPSCAQDNGNAPATQEAPITPALNPPAQNTGTAPLFPEAGSTAPMDRGQPRVIAPIGPVTGAGLGSGPIHAGDIVDVRVFDAPEFDTSMPVSGSGYIALPYAGLFHVEGMTSIEAADAIAALFKQREILRDPHVIVTTQQFGNSVTVLGEVRTPGIYALAGRKRLIDILTEAGGITNQAGHIIEIFPQGSMKNPHSLLWDPTLRENDNADIALKDGETVLVSRCGVVYVGGNVGRPGAFPLCDSNHTTISQVIAIAQGIKPSSKGQQTFLFRTSQSGTRVVQKVQLENVLRGKRPDIIMQQDDIIFVPPSTLKTVGKSAVTTAVAFATQAFFYYGLFQ